MVTGVVCNMADKTESVSVIPDKLAIFYQRSRHYRTVHIDGAQIGLTPRGAIQFTLYSDQKPMPEFVLHQITPEGNLGKQIEEVVKEGFIREVEVNVVMDLAVTQNFITALQEMLEKVNETRELAAKQIEQQQGSIST